MDKCPWCGHTEQHGEPDVRGHCKRCVFPWDQAQWKEGDRMRYERWVAGGKIAFWNPSNA